MKTKTITRLLSYSAMFCMIPSAVSADTITGISDTFLRSNLADDNFSSDKHVLIGFIDDAIFHGIMTFDLSSYSGMSFSDVSLDLTIGTADPSSTPALSTDINIYQLTNASYDVSTATWNNPDGAGGSGSWGTAGGQLGVDYGPDLLASTSGIAQSATVGQVFTFSDSANFRSALDTNAGASISFMITTSAGSGSNRALFRFASEDNDTAGNRPMLNFTATAIPEPTTYAFLVGIGVMGLAAWRRQRSS